MARWIAFSLRFLLVSSTAAVAFTFTGVRRLLKVHSFHGGCRNTMTLLFTRMSPSSNSEAEDKSTMLSKELQTSNHFFSKKSLDDPRFYTLPGEQNNDSKAIFQKLCRASSIETPSRIQALAWPILLQNHPATLIGDQTGSGKTLSYLIPLILKMLLVPHPEQNRIGNSPHILILTPTSELAAQIYSVCKKLSKHVAFRSELTLSAPSSNAQQQQQQSPALPQEQQKPPHGHEQRMKVGGRVYLMLQSKVAQAVDLAPGHKVRVYRPWFALWQQPRQQLGMGRSSSSSTTTTPSIDDACPVVLAHLLSNA